MRNVKIMDKSAVDKFDNGNICPLRQRPQGNTWNSLRSYKSMAETARY